VTQLDTADLVVIAGRVLGISADAALARIDLPAVRAALAEVSQAEVSRPEVSGARPGRDAAAGTCARLMHALLRHRPFPRQAEQLAVAAGLQYLSLNGWRADLDPPATAVVVVEALASGRLSPAGAAAWLAERLSPRPAGRARVLAPLARDLARDLARRLSRPVPAPARTRVRALASLMLTVALGGLALLAAACASGPAAPPAHPAGAVHAGRAAHPAPSYRARLPEPPAARPPAAGRAR
jgi:prophage maintenance system killer protein